MGLVAVLLFITFASEAQSLPVKKGEQAQQESITVKLFPNPSSGEFRIEVNLEEKGVVMAKLFDMTGKLVEDLSAELKFENGKVTGDIHLKDVTPGIHFLRIETGDRSGTKKIIIR